MPRFSIMLLSEDKSEQSFQALKAILGRLLRRFEDDGRTPRVVIEPSDLKQRPMVIANRWRSGNLADDQARRELSRYLARKISEANGFVVFHYDGDKPWSQRSASDAREQFERKLRIRVHQQLLARARELSLSREEISRRMQRLIECVPFYSVEAWTYQATERAVALCHEHHRGADTEKFRKWGADPTLLDDEPQPKEQTCLRDEHNQALGNEVPVSKVVEAGRSLTCFAWALHGCPDLADALVT